MTLSNTKFHRRTAPLLLALGLALTPLSGALAADPPTEQLAAASAAVAAAERAQARGDAAAALAEAHGQYPQHGVGKVKGVATHVQQSRDCFHSTVGMERAHHQMPGE